jgi:predicted dehydrogenase
MRDAINTKILISGLGSIGRRHLANLESLGYTDIAYHRSGKSTIDDQLPDYPTFNDLDQALNEFNPTVVFVCGPSHLHMEVALKSANHGAHLFIEKPLGSSLDGIAELERISTINGIQIMVGYMMRFHPLLQKIKTLIDQKAIGKLVHLRSQWGEYVPDWHPWEDYRDTYAAKRSMGGGPANTLNHEIDMALWFIGEPATIASMHNNASDLELDTEHGVDILIKSTSGTTANLHLDFYQQPPARTSEFVGTTGRISFDYYASRVEVFSADQPKPVKVIDISDSFERNNMFISEIEHLFECIDKNTTPVTSLAEGKSALEVSLKAIEG